MKQLWQTFKNSRLYINHKEELITVPLFFLLLLFTNWIFSKTSSDGEIALFDMRSQTETYVSFFFKFILVAVTALVGLRIIFPPVLKEIYYWYNHWTDLSPQERKIVAIVILTTFLLLGGLIARGSTPEQIRKDLKILMDSQLSIRESWGENRGPEVDMFNKAVGAPLGSYWCAAYVSYDLTYFHVKNPNSAWSPNFAKPQDIIWTNKNKNSKQPLLGDVFTEYYPSLKRVGHTGFYMYTDPEGYFIIQAGNTSGNGSRNGDRVGRKKIQKEKIYAIARYIK